MNFDELVKNAFEQEASGIMQPIEKQQEILNNILLQDQQKDNKLSRRMREKMKLGFFPFSLLDLAGVLILIVVIFAIPNLINNRNMKVETEQPGSSLNTPNENLKVSKEIEDTISDYLVVKYKNLPASLNKNNGKVFEVHKIYSTEENNNSIYVYLYALVERFEITDGKPQAGSGVSIPMTLVLQESNGKHNVVECKEPISGSEYADSIRKMFPSEYAEQAIEDTGHVEEIIKQITAKAEEWAKNEGAKNNSLPYFVEADKYNSQIKDYKTQSDIEQNIKFKIKEPAYLYKNMKKVKVEGRNESSMVNSFDVVVSWYRADDGQEIRIQQTVDTGKPEDLLSRSSKISIDGTDAWIYGNSSGDNFAQIIFWKDGMYYNVSGSIGEDELVKISESIK